MIYMVINYCLVNHKKTSKLCFEKTLWVGALKDFRFWKNVFCLCTALKTFFSPKKISEILDFLGYFIDRDLTKLETK